MFPRPLPSFFQHKAQHLAQNIVHEEVKRKVTDVYDVTGSELGTGISGTVRVCTHKETKIQYALKTLQLHQIRNDEDSMKQLKDEIAILKALDHPNIVRLEEVRGEGGVVFLGGICALTSTNHSKPCN